MSGRAKIFNHRVNRVGSQMSVSCVIQLHHRRERATTETSNAFDGELIVRTGITTFWSFQQAVDVIVNVFRASHVTSCPVANAQSVLASFLETKLMIKSCDANQVGESNAGDFAGSTQRRFWQVPVLTLNALQNRNRRRRRVPRLRQ